MRIIYGLIRKRKFDLIEISKIASTRLEETDTFIWAKESYHVGEVAILERIFKTEASDLWWQLGAVQVDGNLFFFDTIISSEATRNGFSVSWDRNVDTIEYTITPFSIEKNKTEKYIRRQIGLLDVLRPVPNRSIKIK